jgi:hypothetical protein
LPKQKKKPVEGKTRGITMALSLDSGGHAVDVDAPLLARMQQPPTHRYKAGDWVSVHWESAGDLDPTKHCEPPPLLRFWYPAGDLPGTVGDVLRRNPTLVTGWLAQVMKVKPATPNQWLEVRFEDDQSVGEIGGDELYRRVKPADLKKRKWVEKPDQSVVEGILGRRRGKGSCPWELLIKWEGYDDSEATWGSHPRRNVQCLAS